MKKGQISVDLTITIIIAILIITAFSGITTQIKENQKETTLKNQLENQANEISNLINITQVFDDANFIVEKKIMWINFGEKTAPPNITLEENKIILSETLSGKKISAESIFYKKLNTIVEKENDKIVIKHA